MRHYTELKRIWNDVPVPIGICDFGRHSVLIDRATVRSNGNPHFSRDNQRKATIFVMFWHTCDSFCFARGLFNLGFFLLFDCFSGDVAQEVLMELQVGVDVGVAQPASTRRNT